MRKTVVEVDLHSNRGAPAANNDGVDIGDVAGLGNTEIVDNLEIRAELQLVATIYC